MNNLAGSFSPLAFCFAGRCIAGCHGGPGTDQEMTQSNHRTLVAAASAMLLVAIARVLLALGGDFGVACGIVFLFPGMVINLFTRGVHGSWDDPLGEAFMVVVPALGWFCVIRFAFGLVGGKKAD